MTWQDNFRNSMSENGILQEGSTLPRNNPNWEDYMRSAFTPNGVKICGNGGSVVSASIELTGESGTLTDEQIELVKDDSKNVIINNDGQMFYLSDKRPTLTYRTFINVNAAMSSSVEIKAIYVQLDETAVNYGHWSKEDVQ